MAGIRKFEDHQSINRSKRMGVVARVWSDRQGAGHEIYAGRVVGEESNDRWAVEIFGGTAGESTGRVARGVWSPGVTIVIGDWVTLRLAPGEAPLVIGGGGGGDTGLIRHSHSGPEDGGWKSSFDGDY